MHPIIVVTCRDRYNLGCDLANKLGAHLVCDWIMGGAISGHVAAINLASTLGSRSIIIEDDAIPVIGFNDLAAGIIDRMPDDLISFYLGTGYPEAYQHHISLEVNSGADEVRLQNLIHAVAYSIPHGMESRLLGEMDMSQHADFSIGRAWWRMTGREVRYPIPSLADHADGERVEQTGARIHPRRAWRLHQ